MRSANGEVQIRTPSVSLLVLFLLCQTHVTNFPSDIGNQLALGTPAQGDGWRSDAELC